MSAATPRRLALATGALFAVAALLRFWNAGAYPAGWGYDEIQHWRYVELLLSSWALPPPDADWSTAHPPLYHYAAAALVRALGRPEAAAAILPIRLAGSAAGLLSAWLAMRLVQRVDPGSPERALLAAGLVLFLPAHVVMSAMMNEEIVASALVSLAIVLAACELAGEGLGRPRQAALAGAVAGLAWLTKLSGAVTVAAVAGSQLLAGLGLRQASAGLSRAALAATLALLLGGWYYARNVVEYGYVYPHDLEVHARMHTMPPGKREILDYLRLPAATFLDPQAMNPDLLRSVWGTTFAGVFFDAHRHFLPRESDAATRAGTLLLTLALLPTAAFVVGLSRGVRRSLRRPAGPDLPLVLLVAGTLAGYVLFTWRNPWFAAVKGSYLLGLVVPYAYYASEVLVEWAGAPGLRGWLARALLLAFAALVTACFTFGVFSFEHLEYPGMRWQAPEPG